MDMSTPYRRSLMTGSGALTSESSSIPGGPLLQNDISHLGHRNMLHGCCTCLGAMPHRVSKAISHPSRTSAQSTILQLRQQLNCFSHMRLLPFNSEQTACTSHLDVDSCSMPAVHAVQVLLMIASCLEKRHDGAQNNATRSSIIGHIHPTGLALAWLGPVVDGRVAWESSAC